MADSKRIQILKAVATAIDQPGKPSGLTVHRNRQRSIYVDDLPAVVVYPALTPEGTEERVESARIGSAQVRRTLSFRTEIRVELDDATPPDDEMDPIYQWVVGQLAESGNLGGLTHRGPHEQSISSGVDTEGERWVAGMAVDWEAEFDTLRSDPTQ